MREVLARAPAGEPSVASARPVRYNRPGGGVMTAGEDIYGSPEHLAFRDTVRKFVQTELVPRAREFDQLGRIDKSLYRKMCELGLLGIRWDPRDGGQGLDYSYHAVFLEELALCDNAGVAMGISVQTDIATPALARFGRDELKRRYLTPATRGAQANTIGDPHRGFQQQMNQFQDERMVPIVMAPVVSRHLWEVTLKHCQERVVFGKPLAKMQVNQHKFVDMMIQITAAEAFARRCIRQMARGEDATLDISMAKVFCTAVEQFVATTCVQLFGGAGYCWENPAARAFVDSRLISIGGGADEVMKQVVARILQV